MGHRLPRPLRQKTRTRQGSSKRKEEKAAAAAMDTWQAKWKPPRPVHRNPCLVLGCTDEEALKAAFSPFGTIESVFSPKGQKFSFVKFEDKYAAENAMTALNGTEIGGRPVQVTDGKCAHKEVAAWRDSCAAAWHAAKAK